MERTPLTAGLAGPPGTAACGRGGHRLGDDGELDTADQRDVEAWRRRVVRVSVGTPFDEVLRQLTAVRVVCSVERAVEALDAVAALDVGALDPDTFSTWAEGVERLRRTAEAATSTGAQRLEHDNPFRRLGFFSPRSWLQHRLRLSGPEAYRRSQVARMRGRLEAWSAAMQRGEVGVAQAELMARVAANPRVPDAVLRRDQEMLLDDARSLSFEDFERNVRTWEALADPAGDAAAAARRAVSRSLCVRPGPAGGWNVSGMFDELAGNEFVEVLAHFEEAEWRSDWAEARARLGESAGSADLVRTADQRRADALLAMARAAASASPGLRNGPTANVLIDEHSFQAALQGEHVEPVNYRSVVCRTQAGRRLHRDDAVNAALVGHVRRVVVDAAGVVTDLGHRSRLFRGGARDAVMLLATSCVWLGCDRPVRWCQADHSRGWKAHGPTVPRNGAPMCQRHQLLKERGFQVYRDDQGDWHFVDPDGHPVT